MFKKYLVISVLLMVCQVSSVVAAGKPELADTSALKAKFAALLGLEISSIKPSPLQNIMEVITNQGLFYVSKDGNYLLHGKLFSLANGVTNLTENSLATMRLEGIKKFEDNMIVYPAKNEKHVITVFTDITCGYCRKLHKEMAGYNDKGITVRYLAYPRSGIKNALGEPTQNFKNMRSVWCSEDPKQALDKAFSGSTVAYRVCDKKVADEFEFGRQVGVSGTPAIVLENGMMVPGYRGPADMFQVLESLKK